MRNDAPDPRNLTPERVDVAFAAACFRDELDALLQKHQARLLVGWSGKWAKVQVMFPEASTKTVVTIMETTKGKRSRYVLQEEPA